MLYGWTLFFAVIFTVLATSQVSGLWGNWTAWTTCSATCGFGIQTRTRHCTDDAELRCVYRNETEEISCAPEMWCDPVNGGWGGWKSWSNCSRRCGVGSRWRVRTCSNPMPANGGKHCEGNVQAAESCEMAICPPLYDGTDAITCDRGEVVCASGKQCIKEWHRCNWYYDCWDGSDESACAPGEPVVIVDLNTGSRSYSAYVQISIVFTGMIFLLFSSSLL